MQWNKNCNISELVDKNNVQVAQVGTELQCLIKCMR